MLAMAMQPFGEMAFQLSDKETVFAAPSKPKTRQEAKQTANADEWYDDEFHARAESYKDNGWTEKYPNDGPKERQTTLEALSHHTIPDLHCCHHFPHSNLSPARFHIDFIPCFPRHAKGSEAHKGVKAHKGVRLRF